MTAVQWHDAEDRRNDIDELIVCIKKTFPLPLPDDFLVCARDHGGGSPTPCRFDIATERGKTFAKLLSLDPRSKDFFWKHHAKYKSIYDTICPIAQDLEGNYLCYDFNRYKPVSIFYFDVARPYSDKRAQSVSDSFTTLLENLY